MKNRSMRGFAPLLVLVATAVSATAGEGFFSSDGKTVTLVMSPLADELAQVNVETGKYQAIPLPAELKEAAITSVATGAEGEALFLANDSVWVWKEGIVPRKVCDTAPVTEPRDLFVATLTGSPLKDWIFVSGTVVGDAAGDRPTFFARKPGTKNFSSIFCRRVPDAMAGVFTVDGRLFFTSGGDVWEGGIELVDDAGSDRLGTLVGARIAPLATLNTDEANGGGMWVDCVAPAGKWLYAKLRGRHMAAIVRVPVPGAPLYSPSHQDDLPTPKQVYQAMLQSLGKAEVIADGLEDVVGFCACEVAGQPRLFYATRSGEENVGPKLMLWDGSGEPKSIGNAPARR